MKGIKKVQGIVLSSLILLLAACGTNHTSSTGNTDQASNQASTQTTSAASTEAGQKKVLRVGTSATYPPFDFKNEKGEMDGFEIAVLNSVAKKIGYEVEYTTAEFSGLFGMLDTGRIDTIAHKIAINEDRSKKYYFAEPHIYSGGQLVVKEDNNTIKTLDDLAGKKIGGILGNIYLKHIEKYEKEHNVGMQIVPYEDLSGVYNEVALGRLDALINDEVGSLKEIEKSKLPLKLVDSDKYVLQVQNAFVFARNDENQALIEKINTALDELRKDGTLSELSQKWLSKDITKKPE